MNHEITMLPTIRHRLGQIELKLITQRKSMIVLLPKYMNDQFHDLVVQSLHNADRTTCPIYLADITNFELKHPKEILSELTGEEIPDIELTHLFNRLVECYPSGIIHIKDMDLLPLSAYRKWMDTLSLLAKIAHSKPQENAPVFLILTSAPYGQCLPNSDTRLEVEIWLETYSRLDMQVLGRSLYPYEKISVSVFNFWREAVLPEISGSSSELLQKLWGLEENQHQLENFLSILNEYGRSLNWDQKTDSDTFILSKLPRRADIRQFIRNTDNRLLSDLIFEGKVYNTLDYGWELHPSLLALLERHDEIKHRLWRGQSRLILPLVDDLRIKLCLFFNQELGKGWTSEFISPKYNSQLTKSIENPFDVEWGQLNHFVSQKANIPQIKNISQKLIESIRRSLLVRNSIAHYKLVKYHEFNQLWKDRLELSEIQ